jgi:hypothetical protein
LGKIKEVKNIRESKDLIEENFAKIYDFDDENN